MTTALKKANYRAIEAEQYSFLELEFELTDLAAPETLVGKTIFFVTQASENRPAPILVKDQDALTIAQNLITVRLSDSETSWTGDRWFEIWVDWGQGQWQKQFKGTINLAPSSNQNQA